MFDLDFQGQTTFLRIYIIFKVSHHRYITYLWFFEFPHLDYVEFNIKIKSVTCIQPKIMKGIWKYVWPWFSRSTMEVRWHILVILRFQTSDKFKSTPTLCLYHVYNPWWTRGHKKYHWPWFSRSFFEVKWQILITARSLASNTMKSTRRSSLYHIYNQKWRRSYNSQLDLDFEGQLSRLCD